MNEENSIDAAAGEIDRHGIRTGLAVGDVPDLFVIQAAVVSRRGTDFLQLYFYDAGADGIVYKDSGNSPSYIWTRG